MKKVKSKAQRVSHPVKRYSWLVVLLVAVGGLWFHVLGLIMIPIMVTLMVMSIFSGKYWCGNICPHGSWFDGILNPLSRNATLPPLFRAKPVAVLLLIAFMVMLGLRLSSVIPTFGSTGFFDRLGFVFVLNYLVVTVVGSALSLIVNTRSWCFVCPMGTFQLLLYRLGVVMHINRCTDVRLKTAQPEKCIRCKCCSKVCPMYLEPYPDIFSTRDFDHASCIRCGTCAQSCPSGVLKMQKKGNVEESPEKLKKDPVHVPE